MKWCSNLLANGTVLLFLRGVMVFRIIVCLIKVLICSFQLTILFAKLKFKRLFARRLHCDINIFYRINHFSSMMRSLSLLTQKNLRTQTTTFIAVCCFVILEAYEKLSDIVKRIVKGHRCFRGSKVNHYRH